MFNLKSHKITDDTELLKAELTAFNIIKSCNGYDICIGDEPLSAQTLAECEQLIDSGTSELKQHLLETWHDLQHIAQKMLREDGQNSGSLDNLLFLNAVKKAHELSVIFTELEPISQTLRQLMDTDIASSDDRLIKHFNEEYLKAICLHKLIMIEIYRKKLVRRYMTITKIAQISGPWAGNGMMAKKNISIIANDHVENKLDTIQKTKLKLGSIMFGKICPLIHIHTKIENQIRLIRVDIKFRNLRLNICQAKKLLISN